MASLRVDSFTWMIVLLSSIAVGCGRSTAASQEDVAALTAKVESMEKRQTQTHQEVSRLSAIATEGREDVERLSSRTVDQSEITSIRNRLNVLEEIKDSSDERLVRVERVQDAIVAKFRESDQVESNQPVQRTKEYLSTALERGLTRGLSTPLSQEKKLQLLAIYGNLKEKVDAGEDPRIKREMLVVVDANTVFILRQFFPEFLPE